MDRGCEILGPWFGLNDAFRAWRSTWPCARLRAGGLTLAAQESATGKVNLVAGPDVVALYEHLGYEATDSSFMVKQLR
jgi:hypothetical protein